MVTRGPHGRTSVARAFLPDPVLQAVGRGDHLLKASGEWQVHGDGIAKVRVGIEERREDPPVRA